MVNIMELITNDFVKSCVDEKDFTGPFFRLVSMYPDTPLPIGVDPEDPRVQEIIRKAQEANKVA